MYITIDDYRVVIGDEALKAIDRLSPDLRNNAEMEAIEEMASYLRPDYDCYSILSASGDRRSRLLVMYLVDIALYHLFAALPQKMGMEIRKERYERAIKWLEGVQAGRIVPDIPRVDSGDGSESNGNAATNYFSDPKLRHYW